MIVFKVETDIFVVLTWPKELENYKIQRVVNMLKEIQWWIHSIYVYMYRTMDISFLPDGGNDISEFLLIGVFLEEFT